MTAVVELQSGYIAETNWADVANNSTTIASARDALRNRDTKTENSPWHAKTYGENESNYFGIDADLKD
jgi:hypothetical protein